MHHDLHERRGVAVHDLASAQRRVDRRQAATVGLVAAHAVRVEALAEVGEALLRGARDLRRDERHILAARPEEVAVDRRRDREFSGNAVEHREPALRLGRGDQLARFLGVEVLLRADSLEHDSGEPRPVGRDRRRGRQGVAERRGRRKARAVVEERIGELRRERARGHAVVRKHAAGHDRLEHIVFGADERCDHRAPHPARADVAAERRLEHGDAERGVEPPCGQHRLHAHAFVRVLDRARKERREQHAVEAAFGDAQRVGAHHRRQGRERPLDHIAVGRAGALERPQALERKRDLVVGRRSQDAVVERVAHERDGAGIAPLDDALPRERTHGLLRMRKQRREFLGRGACDVRHRAARRIRRHDAPDAAAVERLLELARLDLLAQEGRHEVPVLDHAAVHVGEIDRAIGPARAEHRAEALVGRGEERPLAIGRRRDDSAVLLGNPIAVDEIAGDLAHERGAVHVGAHRAAVMHMRAARAREVRETAILEHALLVAAVHAGREPRREDARVGRRARGHAFEALLRRIARGVLLRQEIDEQWIGVRRVVQPPVRVLAHAPLSVRRDGFGAQRAPIGYEAERVLRADERVVEGEEEAVACVLGVVLAGEPAREDLRRVRTAVAVGVAREEEMRRLDHEDAVAPERDAARHHESIEEHRGFVHLAVAIGVAQHLDAPESLGLARAFGVAHVPAHLDHPQPPVGTELERDGRLDQRLRRDQFNAVSVRHPEGRKRLFGRENGCVGHAPGLGDLSLRLPGAVALLRDRAASEGRRGDEGHGCRKNRRTHACRNAQKERHARSVENDARIAKRFGAPIGDCPQFAAFA